MHIPILSPHTLCRILAVATLAGAASSAALAAPYAITYGSVIQNSSFPEIINGERYTITLVFDNQGSSAASQTWNGSHLTCIIMRMNGTQNVVYAQDLAATPAAASGSAATDASGALTAMFTDVSAVTGVAAGQYTASGFAPAAPVHWYVADDNPIFEGAGGQFFEDPDGPAPVAGPVTPARWTAPTPFSGPCAAAPAPAPGNAAAVPTLGEVGLALLGLAAAGMGARRLRRRG